MCVKGDFGRKDYSNLPRELCKCDCSRELYLDPPFNILFSFLQHLCVARDLSIAAFDRDCRHTNYMRLHALIAYML